MTSTNTQRPAASFVEKAVGAGALVMALCCALLPLLGAAVGGSLITGAGTLGVIAGVAVLVAVIAIVTRRKAGRSC